MVQVVAELRTDGRILKENVLMNDDNKITRFEICSIRLQQSTEASKGNKSLPMFDQIRLRSLSGLILILLKLPSSQ